MTTRDHARPMTEEARTRARRFIHRGPAQPSEPLQALPERLVQARERKGVDLYRAERDTKIRARYLAALERGDYSELPGSVYTRGFLRNYALYLGLDAEDVVRQWHAEQGAAKPAPLTVPRPLLAPRRGLTFSPSIVVAALLTVAVLAFIGYVGVQLLRFAKPPVVAVTVPATAVTQVDDTTTQYTLAGTATPGATIKVATPGREQPYSTSAGPDGTWSLTVDLSRGKNEFQITATDPETGKVTDQPIARVISVPFLVIEAPTLTVDSPADGATFQNGAIPVSGSTKNAKTVTVTPTYLGPPGSAPAGSAAPSPSGAPAARPSPSPATRPSASPSPRPSASPKPGASPGTSPAASPAPSGPAAPAQSVQPADDGSFSVPLELSAGRWSIVVTAVSPQGKSVAITRTVTVQYTGVNLVVTVKGGRAWLKVWVDGKLDPTIGAAGQVFGDGRSLTFTGQSSVEVRTGNSGATTFNLNGQDLGALGSPGVPETWLFAPPAAPQKTNHT